MLIDLTAEKRRKQKRKAADKSLASRYKTFTMKKKLLQSIKQLFAE